MKKTLHVGQEAVYKRLLDKSMAGTFKKACEKDLNALKSYLEAKK
ncbi:hypothetical protein [Bacillus sinesaloumensis]|nr:hypothetical protein [Bacillus sinesaloumensis]